MPNSDRPTVRSVEKIPGWKPRKQPKQKYRALEKGKREPSIEQTGRPTEILPPEQDEALKLLLDEQKALQAKPPSPGLLELVKEIEEEENKPKTSSNQIFRMRVIKKLLEG
jgi:hypothetical protein